tara:strand:+ start:352 stop:813 length:462 start_codon:yes stop_codon:yes gene_type:complete
MSSNYPELFKTIYNGKTYHQSEGLIPSFSRLSKEKDIEEFSNTYPELFNTIYNGKTYHQSEELIPSFSRVKSKEEFTNQLTEECHRATELYTTCKNDKNCKEDVLKERENSMDDLCYINVEIPIRFGKLPASSKVKMEKIAKMEKVQKKQKPQ